MNKDVISYLCGFIADKQTVSVGGKRTWQGLKSSKRVL